MEKPLPVARCYLQCYSNVTVNAVCTPPNNCYHSILWNNQQMQMYAVNFIPLLGSLYMFRVFYTPIIRSTIFKLYLQPLEQIIVSSQLLTPSVVCRPIIIYNINLFYIINKFVLFGAIKSVRASDRDFFFRSVLSAVKNKWTYIQATVCSCSSPFIPVWWPGIRIVPI